MAFAKCWRQELNHLPKPWIKKGSGFTTGLILGHKTLPRTWIKKGSSSTNGLIFDAMPGQDGGLRRGSGSYDWFSSWCCCDIKGMGSDNYNNYHSSLLFHNRWQRLLKPWIKKGFGSYAWFRSWWHHLPRPWIIKESGSYDWFLGVISSQSLGLRRANLGLSASTCCGHGLKGLALSYDWFISWCPNPAKAMDYKGV